MKYNYTRDVSKEMIDALNGVFKPFVDFVKKHKELALCFRGNDSAYGKVIIYWNNHVVWELSIQKNKQAKVEINANHARFMNTWADNIEVLMGLGFKPTKSDLKNKEFKELNTKGKLIKRMRVDQYPITIILLIFQEYLIKTMMLKALLKIPIM